MRSNGLCAGNAFTAAFPALNQQQQDLLRAQSLSHRLSSQGGQNLGPSGKPNSGDSADQSQPGRSTGQLQAGRSPAGLLQPGQLQAGRSAAGLPQPGLFQSGQQMTDQWSQPWMQKLTSMDAMHTAQQQAADQHKASRPQQAQQQASHFSMTSSPAVAADASAKSSSPPQLQPAAETPNTSSPPLSHLAAVQQAQLWIAQQQQKQRQQQQQQQPPSSASPAVSLPGNDAGVHASNIHGNRLVGMPNSMPASSSPAMVSSAEPNRVAESRPTSTDAIMEAQRRTMAYLAARDPKRPPWGQSGDQVGNGKGSSSSSPRQSPTLSDANPKPAGWGHSRVSPSLSANPLSLSANLMQPQGMGLKTAQSFGDPMQSQAASPRHMQPQALVNALRFQSQISSPVQPQGPFSFLHSRSQAHPQAQPPSQGLLGPLQAQPSGLVNSLQSFQRQSSHQGQSPTLQPQSLAGPGGFHSKGPLDVMEIQKLLQNQARSSLRQQPQVGPAEQEKKTDPSASASNDSVTQAA